MYTVKMNKHGATWYYFVENEVGGGFGSNHCGSKKAALAKALRGVKTGASYKLVVNGKETGVFAA